MISTAKLSECGTYRYSLTRVWDGSFRLLPFVMLNPSTADALQDDATIRRCCSFAQREGYGGIYVVNLFAYRATKPAVLMKVGAAVAIGSENAAEFRHMMGLAQVSSKVVCAWGANPLAETIGQDFVRRAQSMKADLFCLGKTTSGAPRHPLYVRGDQPLEVYS